MFVIQIPTERQTIFAQIHSAPLYFLYNYFSLDFYQVSSAYPLPSVPFLNTTRIGKVTLSVNSCRLIIGRYWSFSGDPSIDNF